MVARRAVQTPALSITYEGKSDCAAIYATAVLAQPTDKTDPATNIAELINPQKLATLGIRDANARV